MCAAVFSSMSSRSRSKAISPWIDKGNPGKPPGERGGRSVPNKSWQRTAMEKLRKHPMTAGWGNNQLVMEAKDLTDYDSIMERHFSEIFHNHVAQRVDEQLQEDRGEFVTTTEEQAGIRRSIWRVEDVAKLKIKLLLKRIDTPLPGFASRAASILQMAYGPLHTSLLINDEILLEWNTGSMVIPEVYDSIDRHQRYPIATSVLHRVSSVSLISYDAKDETELMFQAATSKYDILYALVQVIAQYNGQYMYHAISRNCQNFVIDALKAMGCENPPQFQGNLGNYFRSLKAGRRQQDYEDHATLDHYVEERVLNLRPGREPLSTQEKEYLLSQYFMLHMSQITEAEQPKRWVCHERNCQMANLEELIDEEAMTMHKFLHIENAQD